MQGSLQMHLYFHESSLAQPKNFDSTLYQIKALHCFISASGFGGGRN